MSTGKSLSRQLNLRRITVERLYRRQINLYRMFFADFSVNS